MLTCKHFPSGHLRITAAEIAITSARVSGVQDFIVFMKLTSAFPFIYCSYRFLFVLIVDVEATEMFESALNFR